MWKKYFPEFVGTFLIVFLGTGAIVISQEYHDFVGDWGIAGAFGSGVFLAVYFFPSGQFNPAISFALLLFKKLTKKEVIKNIVLQLLGALMASVIIKMTFPENHSLGVTLPSGSSLQSFVLEVFLTFVLMYGALFISTKENNFLSAVVIGGIVFLEAYFAGPISGASMNPARSVAPALVSGNTHSMWIYIIAPVVGASLAKISNLAK